MNIKKIIASAAAAVTTISALTTGFTGIRNVPVNRTAPSANELNEATLEAGDSIGKYIKGLTDDTGKSSQPAGMTASAADINCSVTDLTFDPETFIATAETTQSASCRLKVTLTDDITGIEAASGEFPLTAGENTISEVKLPVLVLPDYYLVTAVIVSNSGVPLSAPFNFKEYTKEMQEIRALTVYDFEEDRVVNLDENTDTNFVVLSDDTIMPESSDTVNTVVSADFDTNTFVFDNVDETLSGVEKGQPLYVRMDDGASIAVEVVDVKEDDGRLTITGSDEKAEEMFDIIKIETVAGTEDCEYEPADGVEMLAFNELPVASINDNGETELEQGTKFEIGAKYKKDKNSEIELEGKVTFSAKLDINFYKRFNYVNFDYGSTYSIKFSVTASTEIGDELSQKLIDFVIHTPIPACYVRVEVGIKVEISADITIEKSYEVKQGIKYDSDVDDEPQTYSSTSNQKGTDTLSLSGKAFVGVYLKPSFNIITKKIFSVSAEVTAGLELTAETTIAEIEGGEIESDIVPALDKDGDMIHPCSFCIEGELAFVVEAKVSIDALFVFHFDLVNAKLKIPFGKWHQRLGENVVWGGECPFKMYRLTYSLGNVDDPEKYTIRLGSYFGDKLGFGESESQFDSSGNAAFFCRSGRYDVTIFADDEKDPVYSKTITINGKAKTIKVNSDGSGSSSGGGGGGGGSAWGDDYKPETTTTTVQTTISYVTTTATSPYDILDAGKLDFGAEYSNAEIDYFYYRNDELHLYCKGDLPDGHLLNNKVESSISGYIYKEECKSVYIENLDESSPITYIPKDFLMNKMEMKYLEEIYIPDTVTEIRDDAFSGCQSLKNIHLPASLKTIGDNAFSECKSLETIEFPETLETIGEEAFYACTSLKEIVIPANTKVISGDAFYGCSSLESVSLPEGLKNIGTESDKYGVFSGCVNLRKINVPDGAELGRYVFSGCSSLESVNIPKNGNVLYCTFMDCTSLKSVEIPSNITTIDRAFDGCTSLRELKLPSTVKHFSFGDYSELEKLYVLNPDAELRFGKEVPENLTIYGYMNSTAYYFAEIYGKNYAINFVSLGEYSIKGDVNGDNVVDTFDLLIMRNAYNRNNDKELYDPIEVDMLTYDID